jgi:preprotein translocase subunit SecG
VSRTSPAESPRRCRQVILDNGQRPQKGTNPVEILQVILQVVLGITSLLLTLLILLHKGRGGGLSDMFGGGTTSNLGASGVAERNLNRFTVILGLVWVSCIVVLGLITKFDVGA